MFPKKGKFFPDRARRLGTEISYEAVIGAALREELRGRHATVKTVMKWTGASERTVKNWLAGRGGPKGPHLVCILRHSERVLAAVLQLAGRQEQLAAVHLLEGRNQIANALEQLDLVLNVGR